MNNKRIVFTSIGNAEFLDAPLRDVYENEVQVKIYASTISSGTERANLMGSKTTSWRVPEAKEAVFPRYAGYSSAGVVLKVGEKVQNICVGDRVALRWSTHTHIQNISSNLVTKIDDIDFKDAAIFHIATFPLAAMRKCRLEIGESAIVMGMGILGLVSLGLLKAAGAAPIIAVDPDPLKREKALKSGADFALDPFDKDFAKTVKEITNGGARVGIEVTGIGAGLDGILDCMAPFGRVALLGCTRSSNFSIDYYRKVHGPGITLVGAHTDARPQYESSQGWWTQADDMQTVMTLHKMGRIKFSSLIDEIYSPENATEIYNRLCNDKTFPIVQFDWSILNEEN